MRSASSLVERLLSALLMAISVALLTAGLFSYASPPIAGDEQPSPAATAIDNPLLGTPSPVVPSPSDPPGSPTASPTIPSPSPSAGGATPSPGVPSPSLAPTATAPPFLPGGGGGAASRIVIPSLRIDLPILAGDAVVRGNRDFYPLCDVAQYLVAYVNPGQPGTSYIYAHAQRGMFLPLLRASQRSDGAEMIGALVEVYTADNRLHLYEIYRVKRHATDLSLANNVDPGEHRLVLQTSEGTSGHIPKLQVAARPIGVLPADPAEANPQPRPRPCWR